MASRGANGCLKVFLIVVNLLFLVFGLAILGVGIYLCTSANLGKYSELLAGMQTLRSVRFLLIIVGCVITLIATCGCFGACKENRCLLVLYVIFLVLILIANISAIVMSVLFSSAVKTYLVEEMESQLKRSYGNTTTDESRSFTNAVDSIQKEQYCCGWRGLQKPNLYPSTPWYEQQRKTNPTNPQKFPESCCVAGVIDDTSKKQKCVQPTNETVARRDGYIHADDCSDKLVALNSRFMHIIISIVLVAILLQIICITCSVVIVRQVSDSDGGRVV